MDLKAEVARLARHSQAGLIDVSGAAAALDLDRSRASRRLADLRAAGWLSRVKRGLYYVRPLEALPDRPAVPEDPWMVASVVYEPCYIGGWSAAEHWDLTEQLFRETFVVTCRAVRSKYSTVLGLRFRLVRIHSEERVTSTELVWRGPERVHVSSPERTIVDGLNDPSWLGGWRHLVDIIDRYLSEEPDRKHLESELSRHGRGAAHKRLGFLLEARRPKEVGLIEAAKGGVTRGVVKLDPSLPRKGSIDSGWGLLVNATA